MHLIFAVDSWGGGGGGGILGGGGPNSIGSLAPNLHASGPAYAWFSLKGPGLQLDILSVGWG